MIQVEPIEFKFVTQIVKIDAGLTQNLEKPKIFHEKYSPKIEISFFREFIAELLVLVLLLTRTVQIATKYSTPTAWKSTTKYNHVEKTKIALFPLNEANR